MSVILLFLLKQNKKSKKTTFSSLLYRIKFHFLLNNFTYLLNFRIILTYLSSVLNYSTPTLVHYFHFLSFYNYLGYLKPQFL